MFLQKALPVHHSMRCFHKTYILFQILVYRMNLLNVVQLLEAYVMPCLQLLLHHRNQAFCTRK